jgi:hypothetical protein
MGWAEFLDGEFSVSGQMVLGTDGHKELWTFLHDRVGFFRRRGFRPTMLAENYRVYGHRSEQHIGSEVVTIQYLGVIKLFGGLSEIPVVLQTAAQAKAFQTDEMLKLWGLYQTNRRHANDAVRHGCYYLLNHKE